MFVSSASSGAGLADSDRLRGAGRGGRCTLGLRAGDLRATDDGRGMVDILLQLSSSGCAGHKVEEVRYIWKSDRIEPEMERK